MTSVKQQIIGMLGAICMIIGWPLVLLAQEGLQVPVPTKDDPIHIHALEIEWYLSMDSLEALAKQVDDPEDTWSLITGFANRETPTRKTRFSWIPLVPGGTDTLLSEANKTLKKRRRKGEFYAYHAFWMGKAWEQYDLKTISHILYLDYIVDPKTGENRNPMPTWSATDLQTKAAEAGTTVDLVVALHGIVPNIIFLADKEAQATLITNVIELLQNPDHPGGGINLDFDLSMYNQQLGNRFDAFALQLYLKMKAVNPDWKLTITLPGRMSESSNGLRSMRLFAHRFLLLGYDHHNRDQASGPVSLWESKGKWQGANILEDLNYFRREGIPYSKMVLILPQYGVSWQADSPNPGAGSLNDSMQIAPVARYKERFGKNPKREPLSHSVYAIERAKDADGKALTGIWQHHWWEDRTAMTRKFTYAQRLGLGGVGIWALGFENQPEFQPEIIPLLLAASKIVHKEPVPEKVIEVKDTVKEVVLPLPVQEEPDKLVPGRPLSFINGYDGTCLQQIFWVQVDSFLPLLPSTDEEFLFLSPDIALPLSPQPLKMAVWGLIFLGCFLELGLIWSLIRFAHRMLIFVEQPILGMAQLLLIVGGGLIIAIGFGVEIQWYWIVTGLVLALGASIFWRRSMADKK